MTEGQRSSLYMFDHDQCLCVVSHLGEALPMTPDETKFLQAECEKKEIEKTKLKKELSRIQDELKKIQE